MSAVVSKAPRMSHSAAKNNQKQMVQIQQQRLLLLNHSSICKTPAGECVVTPHCQKMKALWKHMLDCKNADCQVPHCISSRYVLSHYVACTDKHCLICPPVRAATKRQRNETTDAKLDALINKRQRTTYFWSTQQLSYFCRHVAALPSRLIRGTDTMSEDFSKVCIGTTEVDATATSLHSSTSMDNATRSSSESNRSSLSNVSEDNGQYCEVGTCSSMPTSVCHTLQAVPAITSAKVTDVAEVDPVEVIPVVTLEDTDISHLEVLEPEEATVDSEALPSVSSVAQSSNPSLALTIPPAHKILVQANDNDDNALNSGENFELSR